MSRRRVVVAALWFGLTLATGQSTARAREPATPAARTVLVIAPVDDRTGTRVKAELRALGFDVVEVTDRPVPQRDFELELSARSLRAVAAIAVGGAGKGARVWTKAPSADGLVLRATIEEGADPAVVAFRTVEALRTSMADLQPPASTPVLSGPAALPIVERPSGIPRELPDRWGASIAPALSVTPGGPSEAWQAQAILYWLWRRRWGMEALGTIPLSGARWTESEGTAMVTYGFAAGGIRWEPFATQRHSGDAGAGVGIAWIHAEGSPTPGFVGDSTNRTLAAPYARIGYGFAIVPWLRVRADLAAFVAVPRPIFTFAGRDGGTWGQPLLSGSIGLDVSR